MAFKIIRNDITQVCADAIVNTANPQPTYAGGTDAAIYKAAGEEKLLEERKKIGVIEVGQAVETPAFQLNARYIIHTVGPEWTDGEHGEYDAVRSCYMNSLKLAKKLGCESIAVPLIATGVYGFPKSEALRIAVSVFSEFLVDEEMQITLVITKKRSGFKKRNLFQKQIKSEKHSDASIDSMEIDEAFFEDSSLIPTMSSMPTMSPMPTMMQA